MSLSCALLQTLRPWTVLTFLAFLLVLHTNPGSAISCAVCTNLVPYYKNFTIALLDPGFTNQQKDNKKWALNRGCYGLDTQSVNCGDDISYCFASHGTFTPRVADTTKRSNMSGFIRTCGSFEMSAIFGRRKATDQFGVVRIPAYPNFGTEDDCYDYPACDITLRTNPYASLTFDGVICICIDYDNCNEGETYRFETPTLRNSSVSCMKYNPALITPNQTLVTLTSGDILGYPKM